MAGTEGNAKYYNLMMELKEAIQAGRLSPGEKLHSENQLAAEYGLSRHTVRKALNLLAADGYIYSEQGRGTFCSERLRHMKRSHNIAVVITYITDYIFPRLIQGMDHVLSANGYSIILKSTGNSRKLEARALEDILKKDVDGLIIEPSKSQLVCRHEHLYRMLDEYEIPYIFIQGIYEQMEDKPHILMDDCRGGYLVTRHLLELGHRRIAGVFKVDDFQGRERHKGYVRALQEAGLPYDPDLVIWFHTEDRKTKPAMAVEKFISRRVPLDAVVCYNDQIAMGVYHKLREMGIRIPEDISLTGYDNSLYARGEIKLTTIAHPQEKLGEMAAELLLEQIRHVPEGESRVKRLIEPELIPGNSCRSRL